MKEKDKTTDNKKTYRKNKLIVIVVVCVVVLTLIATLLLTRQNVQREISQKKIEQAKDSISGEKLWQEHLESGIKEEEKERKGDTSLLSKRLEKLQKALEKEQGSTIEELKFDIQKLKLKLDHLEREQILRENDSKNNSVKEVPSQISINKIESEVTVKDISSYIPANTYVRGKLLNGLSLPTGANAPDESHNAVITLTDNASMPNFFDYDIKNCRILTSGYGNISSERAILRLETLFCVNSKTRKTIETTVVGFVSGPDGLNGIKGSLVSVDSKYIKNALMAGVVSGFSGAVSDKEDANISRIIAPGAKEERKNFKDKFTNNFTEGIGKTSNVLTDYYIRNAERIQPVVQVPAGVDVTVVFTQGVFLGSNNAKKTISNERKN